MIISTIEKIRQKLTVVQPVLLWIFTLYYTQTFLRNGIRKFDPEGFWAPAFDRWGYGTWFMFLIGIMETAGAILILIPKVRHFGSLMLAVVMLGAFITKAIHSFNLSDAVYIFATMVFMLYLSTDLSNKESRNLPTQD